MAKLPAPEKLLTINDVAALCQVSSKTVRRWITAGELQAAQFGNQWIIRPLTSIISSETGSLGDQACLLISQQTNAL